MKFSVATPVFNGLPWLRCCVASVRDQIEEKVESEKRKEEKLDSQSPPAISHLPSSISSTLRVEHLIQDAGSDGIEDFAHETGAEFGNRSSEIGDRRLPPTPNSHLPSPTSPYRLAICSEPDRGMYDAINRAWRRSTGDIISYLNADEQYLPETLRKVADFFAAHPEVELVFGDALLLNAQGKPLSYRRVVKPSRAHTRTVHLSTLSCAMFFRRTLLDRGFYLDDQWRAIGDAEWVWRVLGAGARTAVIPEALSAFTMTGTNLGATPASLKEAEAWRQGGSGLERRAAPLLRVIHWARKAAAGAYRKRAIDTAVFTCESPHQRVRITHEGLGSAWPGAGG